MAATGRPSFSGGDQCEGKHTTPAAIRHRPSRRSKTTRSSGTSKAAASSGGHSWLQPGVPWPGTPAERLRRGDECLAPARLDSGRDGYFVVDGSGAAALYGRATPRGRGREVANGASRSARVPMVSHGGSAPQGQLVQPARRRGDHGAGLYQRHDNRREIVSLRSMTSSSGPGPQDEPGVRDEPGSNEGFTHLDEPCSTALTRPSEISWTIWTGSVTG